MSLKAKIEAVIYACEEPVTLAQLVGLLGDEAQAELDRSVSAQQTLSLDELEAAEADPTLGPEFDADNAGPVAEAGPPAAPDSADSPGNSDAGEASGILATERNPQTAEQTGSAADSASDLALDSSAFDAAAAAARAERARLARLRAHFRVLLDQLIAEYAAPESDRGLEIREVAGGFRFATKPEYHDAVRGFVRTLKPPLKLTLQSLETLAVVAYKQPVTAPEISEIRGVDSSGVLGSLLARKLIATAGRKHVIGRPILYKTTREFLLKFGLKDVSELPSIEEFEKMAGQLAEQEEMAMESGTPAPSEESESPTSETEDDASDPSAAKDGIQSGKSL
jgi:segregation and condensation protein B